ncbi:MAG: hypothetical protein ACOC83_02490 [Gemmatimonadota bacterium]
MSAAPTRRHAGPAAVLALILTVALAGGAVAQSQAPPAQTGPEFAVSASVLAPLAELTSSVAFTTEVSSAVGASGTLTHWFGERLGLTVQGVWAPGELNVRPSEFTGPIPPGLGDADYLAGTAALTYRVPTSGALAAVEPFFGLGAGARHLSLDPVAAPDAEDATDPVGTVLAGVTTRVWPSVAVRLEIRDLVSVYESPLDGEERLQNDALVSVGVSLRP